MKRYRMCQMLWLKHLLTLVLIITSVYTAQAEEDKPSGDLSTSILSQYIWRGYENTRNSIVVQPSLTVGYKNFSANVWGNIDTRPYSQTIATYPGAGTEMDITLSYNKSFGIVNAGGGYIYYALDAPNTGAVKPLDSEEIFVTIGINTLLSPTLTAYKEIDHYHQYYFLLGVSHTLELNKTISLKLSGSASYLLSDYANASLYNINPSYGGYPKFTDTHQATNDKFSNFHDGVLSVSLPINLAQYITLVPIVSYSFALSNVAKNEIMARGKKADLADNDSSFIYGGLTFDLSF